jgi:hypothetical protein
MTQYRPAEQALRIRADLDEWWLSLGLDTDLGGRTRSCKQYTALFKCLYHYQIVQLNRHSLSLPKESIHHRHALQSIILAMRTITITINNELLAQSPTIPWPGYVDMLFFASLLIAYNAKLNPGTLER